MAEGRLLKRAITKSDKFNDLFKHNGLAELSQIIYFTTYLYADDWGHVPFDSSWVRRECMPDTKRSQGDVKRAMVNLLGGLWEYAYDSDGKHYARIYEFEKHSHDGIRNRRRGQFPDESGEVPRRKKDESFEKSMEAAKEVRSGAKKITS